MSETLAKAVLIFFVYPFVVSRSIVYKALLHDNAERVNGCTKTVGLVISLGSWQKLFRTPQTPKGDRINGELADKGWKNERQGLLITLKVRCKLGQWGPGD